MVFKPQKSYGPWIGLLAGIIIFGFVFWGINYSLGPEDQILKILLLLPAVVFAFVGAYLVFGAFNTRYVIEDERLHLHWGIFHKTVAWSEFSEVIQIKGEATLFPFLSASWPGYIAGLYTMQGFGPVRIFGSKWEDGFVYMKTSRGFFGVTPGDDRFIQTIAEKTGLEIQEINMDEVPKHVKGTSLKNDNVFSMYYKMNVIALGMLALYIAIFYPGSSAPPFIILLLVIALALFFFTVSNAGRLVQFSAIGGYATLLMGVAVTGAFLIMSFATISLQL